MKSHQDHDRSRRLRALRHRVFAVSLIVVTSATCLGLIYIGFVQKITPPSDSGRTSPTASKAAAPRTAAATTPTTAATSRPAQTSTATTPAKLGAGSVNSLLAGTL